MKVLLSIQGGGTRGIASAVFLRRLEEELISRYGGTLQDYIHSYSGTSIGSIIATYLATGRTAGNMVDILTQRRFLDMVLTKHILNQIFGWIPGIKYLIPQYVGHPKTRVINELIGEDLYLSDVSRDLMIITYNITKRTLTSWNNFDDSLLDPNLASLIDASSAAPGYFPSIMIKTREGGGQSSAHYTIPGLSYPDADDYHIDGGVGASCPVSVSYFMLKKKYPDEDIKVLSIGNGYQTGAIWHGHGTTLGWLTGGLQYSIVDAPTQIYNSEAFLSSNAFMRVDVPISDGMSGKVDASSVDEIVKLIDLGNSMFDQYGEEAIRFLTR